MTDSPLRSPVSDELPIEESHVVDWLSHFAEQIEDTMSMITDELGLDDVKGQQSHDAIQQQMDIFRLTDFPLDDSDWAAERRPVDFW